MGNDTRETSMQNPHDLRGRWKSIAPDMTVPQGLSRIRYMAKGSQAVMVEIFIQRDTEHGTEYGCRVWRTKKDKWAWPAWHCWPTFHTLKEAREAARKYVPPAREREHWEE